MLVIENDETKKRKEIFFFFGTKIQKAKISRSNEERRGTTALANILIWGFCLSISKHYGVPEEASTPIKLPLFDISYVWSLTENKWSQWREEKPPFYIQIAYFDAFKDRKMKKKKRDEDYKCMQS